MPKKLHTYSIIVRNLKWKFPAVTFKSRANISSARQPLDAIVIVKVYVTLLLCVK